MRLQTRAAGNRSLTGKLCWELVVKDIVCRRSEAGGGRREVETMVSTVGNKSKVPNCEAGRQAVYRWDWRAYHERLLAEVVQRRPADRLVRLWQGWVSMWTKWVGRQSGEGWLWTLVLNTACLISTRWRSWEERWRLHPQEKSRHCGKLLWLTQTTTISLFNFFKLIN